MNLETGSKALPHDISAYQEFSEVYDLLGFHRFTGLAVEKCQEFLAQSERVVSRLLDLGCGTGHFAIELARLGIDVTGIDGAPGMLKKAARNAGRMKNAPEWTQGYFTDFQTSGHFDLVTCWFDSLNHLITDRQLLACFRRVRRALKPGGAFIFDVNTPRAFKDRWALSNYRSTADYAMHLQGVAESGGEFGTLEIELFLRRGKRYERRHLCFRQRGYTATHIRRLLKQARFSGVAVAPFDPQDRLPSASRILVSAAR